MNKIAQGFLKDQRQRAMSSVGRCSGACNSASSSLHRRFCRISFLHPGTYEGTAEGISSTVKGHREAFSNSRCHQRGRRYGRDATLPMGAAATDQLKGGACASSAEIDGVSVYRGLRCRRRADQSTLAQAKGRSHRVQRSYTTVTETDWLEQGAGYRRYAITGP